MQPEKKNFDEMKKIKGVPYEIIGETAIAYPENGEPVQVPLIIGKSAYASIHGALFSKTKGPRSKGGNYVIGNFSYAVEDNVLKVTAIKDGRVVGTKVLETETEQRYPRNHAISIIVTTLE